MPPHTHELTAEELFCLEGCRSYKQYYRMRTDFEAELCTFCQLDREFNHVLWEDERAMLWKVPEEYLRDTLALHALLVPKRHVRFEAELTDNEALSLHQGKRYIHSILGYQGGLTHVREGDMRLNAGTVPHLHINYFQPNRTGEVRVPAYKDPGDREQNEQRTAAFAARYEAGELP